MIGLDINVLVRYIVQDAPEQAAAAAALIESQCSTERPGWIDSVALCQLVWVLESAHGYPRDVVADVLTQLLNTAELDVESPDQTWLALRAYRQDRADFADYLIGARNKAQGCKVTYTFDKRAAKSHWHRLVGSTCL